MNELRKEMKSRRRILRDAAADKTLGIFSTSEIFIDKQAKGFIAEFARNHQRVTSGYILVAFHDQSFLKISYKYIGP